jgi:hypothetical protein
MSVYVTASVAGGSECARMNIKVSAGYSCTCHTKRLCESTCYMSLIYLRFENDIFNRKSNTKHFVIDRVKESIKSIEMSRRQNAPFTSEFRKTYFMLGISSLISSKGGRCHSRGNFD